MTLGRGAVASAIAFVGLLGAAACGGAGTSSAEGQARDASRPDGSSGDSAGPTDAGAATKRAAALAELGRHLFYDKRLSFNGETACANCHIQEKAFSDGERTPTGATGQRLSRNAQPLFNLTDRSTYTWANPTLVTLERQADVPIFSDIVIELGATGHEATILSRLAQDATYGSLHLEAFDEPVASLSFAKITSALAAFERTLVARDSAYDRSLRGDPNALSPAAKRGRDLFFSQECECYHCHEGRDFTRSIRTEAPSSYRPSFANNGLYDLDGQGAYPPDNTGLYEITQKPSDMGMFRIPSLRNVGVTAPYMHDGSLPTLESVVEHYARGGRLVETGPNKGDGAKSRLKDSLLRGFVLSDDDKAALVSFLRALTDEGFLHDPRFQDPWPKVRDEAN